MRVFKKIFKQKGEQTTLPTMDFKAYDARVQSISVDEEYIYTLGRGVIKKWRKRDGELVSTFGETDNNFLLVDEEYILSGYYEKSFGVGRKHENIRVWDKDGNLIRTLDAPSPSLGQTFRDIYEVGFVSVNASYIYGLYRLDFQKEQSGSRTGHIVIMVWDKKGDLVNSLQDASCPDSYFAIDDRYIYALSRLDTLAVKGLYIYDKSNPLNITRIKRMKDIKPHYILVDDRHVYLYKRRHIQVLDKSAWRTIWERKNKITDEISKIYIDDNYLYVLHYGLRHNQLDICNKNNDAIVKIIYADNTINCVVTDDKNIYAGISNGMVNVWEWT